MKKIVISMCLIAFVFTSEAQKKEASNNSYMNLENGLLLTFNDSAYAFQLGGFIQPTLILKQQEGIDNELFLNAKRAFLHIGGAAYQEKVSFFIQTNFSESQPLFDAWVAYHPTKNITITAGQKQNFANNREMLYREDRLQFTERSMLSEQLSRTGREFGLFVEARYGSKMGFVPMAAITSGDGRNSFGEDSRDVDLGGLKYSGRLDVYPLGFFKPGNDLYSSDLMHEKSLKFVLGSAFSINRGASGRVGESHGDFLLYNENGRVSLPNYQKVYVDFLAKYKGFSLLAEYGNATANGLGETFIDANAVIRMVPQQISTFMALGNTYNTQLGYVSKKGYSFDVRYTMITPEFTAFSENVLPQTNNLTLGFTKYFKGHQSKLQAALNVIDTEGTPQTLLWELMFQVGF